MRLVGGGELKGKGTNGGCLSYVCAKSGDGGAGVACCEVCAVKNFVRGTKDEGEGFGLVVPLRGGGCDGKSGEDGGAEHGDGWQGK